MKNTYPQTDQSLKETSRTLFQICVRLQDQASDILSEANMARMRPPLVDLTIMDSFLMSPAISSLSLVQAQIELKRDVVNQVISLTSTPILTISGDVDLSQLASSSLKEQVISPVITSIKSMLPKVMQQISPSCLEGLASVMTSRSPVLLVTVNTATPTPIPADE